MSSQRDWHIPFQQDNLTLRAARDSVPPTMGQVELPLMLRLQRDPELSFLGQLVFKAGLDQQQHDCIHILLGRGMLPMDQAFVLGFTIGCSRKGCLPEHRLYSDVGRHFFKQVHLFDDAEAAVFKEGIKQAYLSFCAPLENFDFMPWYDQTLRQLRQAIGLDAELMLAYYAVEKYRYPQVPASQRLLHKPAQIASV